MLLRRYSFALCRTEPVQLCFHNDSNSEKGDTYVCFALNISRDWDFPFSNSNDAWLMICSHIQIVFNRHLDNYHCFLNFMTMKMKASVFIWMIQIRGHIRPWALLIIYLVIILFLYIFPVLTLLIHCIKLL
jgi:hypothetical protein